jgi:hypothetical protein
MPETPPSQPDEVIRLEAWQLPAYLRRLERAGTTEVAWNKERLSIADALARTAGVSPTATVVADGTTIYVAEPDHSPDNAPAVGPIQLGPRR